MADWKNTPSLRTIYKAHVVCIIFPETWHFRASICTSRIVFEFKALQLLRSIAVGTLSQKDFACRKNCGLVSFRFSSFLRQREAREETEKADFVAGNQIFELSYLCAISITWRAGSGVVDLRACINTREGLSAGNQMPVIFRKPLSDGNTFFR